MKQYSLSIVFCILAFSAFSQGDGNTSVVYNVAIPMGNTSDYIDETSFRGVMIKGDYFIEDEWSFGFATGVQTFYQEMGTVSETRGTFTATGAQFRYLNSIPILLTAKYHYSRYGTFSPYAGLGAGLYYMNQTTKFAGLDFEKTDWKFGLQPEIGLGIELSPSTDFLLAVTYNTAFDSKEIDAQGYLGFQVGLTFAP